MAAAVSAAAILNNKEIHERDNGMAINPDIMASAYADVYIVSQDRRFSRMIQLVLEEEGFTAAIVNTLPKKRCFSIVDLDSAKASSGADITFSTDATLEPTFVRPFEMDAFVRQVRSRLSAEETDSEDFALVPGALIYNKSVIPLSEIEYLIFEILLEKRGTAVSAEEITRRVWDGEEKGNSLVVYINYLRKKIDFRFGKRFIVTVRGIGYMLAGSGDLK